MAEGHNGIKKNRFSWANIIPLRFAVPVNNNTGMIISPNDTS